MNNLTYYINNMIEKIYEFINSKFYKKSEFEIIKLKFYEIEKKDENNYLVKEFKKINFLEMYAKIKKIHPKIDQYAEIHKIINYLKFKKNEINIMLNTHPGKLTHDIVIQNTTLKTLIDELSVLNEIKNYKLE